MLTGKSFQTFLIAALLLPAFCFCQEPAEGVFPLKDSAIYYEKVVTADSLTKDQLYKIIKSWGVNNFSSQKDALQADDRETGLIAYKAFFTERFDAPELKGMKASADWKYWIVLKIFLKDGKAKIVVEDVKMENVSILHFKELFEPALKNKYFSSTYKENYYRETRKNFISANEHIYDLMASLQKKIASGSSEFNF